MISSCQGYLCKLVGTKLPSLVVKPASFLINVVPLLPKAETHRTMKPHISQESCSREDGAKLALPGSGHQQLRPAYEVGSAFRLSNRLHPPPDFRPCGLGADDAHGALAGSTSNCGKSSKDDGSVLHATCPHGLVCTHGSTCHGSGSNKMQHVLNVQIPVLKHTTGLKSKVSCGW